jgi:hypothetical protein
MLDLDCYGLIEGMASTVANYYRGVGMYDI